MRKRKYSGIVEDTDAVLQAKVKKLASALIKSKCAVIYTGAGISTAADIPDYRGPDGVWTLAKSGKSLTKACNPVNADPTLSHMALKEMLSAGYVDHILSQNCDGLHLRSGIPQKFLSEIHGNMYIEVCTACKPLRQYIRNFDCTTQTRFRRHRTGRCCVHCGSDLIDTIVHFGERGKLRWPLNWQNALSAIAKCDLIICLGTSLQILKKYAFLWCYDRPIKQRPKLFIVNFQSTPKDRLATCKINGRCDTVMDLLMQHLHRNIPKYCRQCDPVMATNRRNCKHNASLMNEISECRCKNSNDEYDDEDLTLAEIKRKFSSDAEKNFADGENSAIEVEKVENMKNHEPPQKSATNPEKIREKADAEYLPSNHDPVFPGWWKAGLLKVSSKKRKKRRLSKSVSSSEHDLTLRNA